MIWSIALVAVLSLALSEYASRYHPSANFYLLPTRAWELMAGASVLVRHRKATASRAIMCCPWLGLAAIAVSVFAYDETIPLPSLYALLPVLGTLRYHSSSQGRGRWWARCYRLKPIVGIGLISYSAYLWHQPLFAFARIRSLTEPTWQLMLVLTVASLTLAYLSWRIVEVPRKEARCLAIAE